MRRLLFDDYGVRLGVIFALCVAVMVAAILALLLFADSSCAQSTYNPVSPNPANPGYYNPINPSNPANYGPGGVYHSEGC